MVNSSPQVRCRWIYIGAAILVIALGLSSRKYPGIFPSVLEKYPGDALWALMVFLGYCTCLPNARTWKVAVLALLTSFAVEFSQIYQAPWINAIRGTTLGHLVLGSAFNWLDLVAYTVGVALGSACDKMWLMWGGISQSNGTKRDRQQPQG
jgi:hypothetical protein